MSRVVNVELTKFKEASQSGKVGREKCASIISCGAVLADVLTKHIYALEVYARALDRVRDKMAQRELRDKYQRCVEDVTAKIIQWNEAVPVITRFLSDPLNPQNDLMELDELRERIDADFHLVNQLIDSEISDLLDNEDFHGPFPMGEPNGAAAVAVPETMQSIKWSIIACVLMADIFNLVQIGGYSFTQPDDIIDIRSLRELLPTPKEPTSDYQERLVALFNHFKDTIALGVVDREEFVFNTEDNSIEEETEEELDDEIEEETEEETDDETDEDATNKKREH